MHCVAIHTLCHLYLKRTRNYLVYFDILSKRRLFFYFKLIYMKKICFNSYAYITSLEPRFKCVHDLSDIKFKHIKKRVYFSRGF